MSKIVFRSPRSGTAAAATAPAWLARELHEEVLWRERPDGAIEVAAKREREVDRYLVQADGSMTLVG